MCFYFMCRMSEFSFLRPLLLTFVLFPRHGAKRGPLKHLKKETRKKVSREPRQASSAKPFPRFPREETHVVEGGRVGAGGGHGHLHLKGGNQGVVGGTSCLVAPLPARAQTASGQVLRGRGLVLAHKAQEGVLYGGQSRSKQHVSDGTVQGSA